MPMTKFPSKYNVAMSVEASHHAYSDETHHNFGRFKGIAVISASLDEATLASREVGTLLAEVNLSELKWEKLRTARDRVGALKIAELFFRKLDVLRADILTWDIEDSRHRLHGRDDVENMHRMYHHLLKDVLRKRWPTGAKWRLYPDQQDSIDWERVHDILDNAGTVAQFQSELSKPLTFRLQLKRDFSVVQVVPSQSHVEPLIQLADLMAGMAAFSRTHIDTYRAWKRQASGQTSLFDLPIEKFSRGEQEKCAFLANFKDRCRKLGLSVSLNSTNGLRTHDQRGALNFWHYEPQRQSDKAPTRNR